MVIFIYFYCPFPLPFSSATEVSGFFFFKWLRYLVSIPILWKHPRVFLFFSFSFTLWWWLFAITTLISILSLSPNPRQGLVPAYAFVPPQCACLVSHTVTSLDWRALSAFGIITSLISILSVRELSHYVALRLCATVKGWKATNLQGIHYVSLLTIL